MKPAVLAAALLVSASLVANAQEAPLTVRPMCAPQEKITQGLSQRYGELPSAAGLLGDGTMLQIFATPDGDTFTVVIAKPDGTACVLSGGQSWSIVHPKLPGDPA